MITLTFHIKQVSPGQVDIDVDPVNAECNEDEYQTLQKFLQAFDSALRDLGADCSSPIQMSAYIKR